MSDWILSSDAEEDLQDIFLYTTQNWGDRRARVYLNELFELFATLALQPEMGRSREELGDGIRSFPHRSHIVFFMEWRGETAISRVLHGARDIDSAFVDFDPAAGFR